MQDSDVYGDGVNVAARLEGLAKPGGVVVSDDVMRQVRGKVEIDFRDLGPQTVKNIAEPVQAYAVDPACSPPLAARRAALPLPEKPSIAVLPFENMSGDPEQEYFADGIAEDIITALSRFHWFFVIARSSNFSYKGTSPNRLDMLQCSGMWTERRPRLTDWFDRVKARPSFGPAMFEYIPGALIALMKEKGIEAWPKVKAILAEGG